MNKIEEARKQLMDFAENLKKDLGAESIEITASSNQYRTACSVEMRFLSRREIYQDGSGSC